MGLFWLDGTITIASTAYMWVESGNELRGKIGLPIHTFVVI